MIARRTILATLAAAFLSTAAHADATADLVAPLNGKHPSAYYETALKIFNSGKREEAVFVFYLGQLRYRTLLAAKPDLPPDQDPALFDALSESVGRPLNEYAFGDIAGADKILQAVLDYDTANPDTFTPPSQFPEAAAKTREGMEKFRKYMQDNAADIRAQRKANGLENRTE
jgi:hypothetical protein